MAKSLEFPQMPLLSKECADSRTLDSSKVDISRKIDPELLSLWRRAYPNIVKVLGSPTEYDTHRKNEEDDLSGSLLR